MDESPAALHCERSAVRETTKSRRLRARGWGKIRVTTNFSRARVCGDSTRLGLLVAAAIILVMSRDETTRT